MRSGWALWARRSRAEFPKIGSSNRPSHSSTVRFEVTMKLLWRCRSMISSYRSWLCWPERRQRRNVGSKVWSARAWPSSLSSTSARRKSTLCPARTAAAPSAWARNVLPTPTGPTKMTCSVGEKLEREEHLELAPVELDRAGPVEGLQGRALLEASQVEAPLERLLVTALDLVGQQQGQERRVVELLSPRQGQPLWQGGRARPA